MAKSAGLRGAIVDPRLQEQAEADARELLRDVALVLQREPALDPDTVRHALALLRLDPLTRLNRSLIRGRAAAVHPA